MGFVQVVNWMNFGFGGIFVHENCSAARNACWLKVGFKVTFNSKQE